MAINAKTIVDLIITKGYPLTARDIAVAAKIDAPSEILMGIRDICYDCDQLVAIETPGQPVKFRIAAWAGFVATFNGVSKDVYATSLWDAKVKAVDLFKPRQSQVHKVHVMLAERADGSQVVHTLV